MIYEVDDPSWLVKAFNSDDDFVAPAPGISVVQHKSIAGTAGATQTLAFTSNNTAGNMLIYSCGGEGGGSSVTLTDNNSNTIVSLDLSGNGTLTSYVKTCNPGANTVTASCTGSTRIHLHIWEINGVSTVDQHRFTSQAATAQSISTSSATSFANELVYGFFYDQPNNDSFTAGSGFSPSEFSNGASGDESALSEVKVVSSTGVQTATATCGSASSTIQQEISTYH